MKKEPKTTPPAKTLFVLETMEIKRKRRRHHEDYPNFTIEKIATSDHENLHDAEAEIFDILNNTDNYVNLNDIYCFYVQELPYNLSLYGTDQSLSTRVYDSSGKKVDERLYPTSFYGSFFKGRPKTKLRFQKGEVAEYRGELVIIAAGPVEHHANRILDDSDDCYYALCLDQEFDKKGDINHCHPECIYVMPPRFPIPPKTQAQIEKVKQWYFNHILQNFERF